MSDYLQPHGLQHAKASQFFTISRSLLKLMSIELVMPSNHLILCHPLLLLPSIFPRIRVFSNESVVYISWPKDWSFSFSISPSNEYSGLISLRTDWLDLLAVQGTLKSFLQHHSSKASVLQHTAFFMVQLSHPYMTTGKTIAFTRWTFVHKVMPLLFRTQGSNPGIPYCRWILYHLSHQGSPRILEWVASPFSRGTSQPSNRTGVSCIGNTDSVGKKIGTIPYVLFCFILCLNIKSIWLLY